MKTSNKFVFFIVAAITALMAYIALFGVKLPIGRYDLVIPGAPNMRYGIDIRGGVDAVFEPKDLNRKPTAEELEAARNIIELRLDQKNILDRDVTVDQQNGYIMVRFPWKSDETDFNPQQAIAELGETARLTFRDSSGNIMAEGDHVTKSTPAIDQSTVNGGYLVQLEFDSVGTQEFADATEKLLGQPMSIYMDDTLIETATVEAHITDGKAVINNIGGAKQAQDLASKISTGALPFSMTSKNHSTISPTLGKGALEVMVKAGVLAFSIICLFLLSYYRMSGFVACISLLMQVAGQLLALAIPQITVTLPGIAGVILSIGMGVDANVIISERISEEIKGGKRLSSAISSGFHRAFSSVFDGNITVLIVAIIMMILGSGSMLSFAYTLLTGIIFNFLAGVTASRLMIRSLTQFEFLQKPVLFTCPTRRID